VTVQHVTLMRGRIRIADRNASAVARYSCPRPDGGTFRSNCTRPYALIVVWPRLHTDNRAAGTSIRAGHANPALLFWSFPVALLSFCLFETVVEWRIDIAHGGVNRRDAID
jgi:hypothetical protein